MHYDYLVVGSGLFGAAFAQRMHEIGKSVLVIERRNHIGGNVYTEEVEGINVHRYVKKMYYLNADLYRYYIGREGQSVQRDVMTKRYQHQLTVTQKCFEAAHLDEIKDTRQQKYLKHELFMMFGISVLYSRLNKSEEADENLSKMWESCYAFDPKWAEHFQKHTPLRLISIPGKVGRNLSSTVYTAANRVVRFN